VAALGLLGSSCTLVYPLDEYDGGLGAGGSTSATGETTGVSTASSSTGGGQGGAPPCGSGLYPPAASLVDTFDVGGDQNFFGTCGGAPILVEGELRFDLPPTGMLYCDATSRIPYCLESSSITVKVPEAATAPIPGMQTWIVLTPADSSGEVRLLVEGNGFGLMGTAGGMPFELPIANAAYDPFAAAWWRLAGEGGELVLSTSPDGQTWDERVRGAVPVALDGVFVSFAANRYYNDAFPESASLPAETARFDCYNKTSGCP
jgi:hypothetical protein